jgi:hypothetical protein
MKRKCGDCGSVWEASRVPGLKSGETHNTGCPTGLWLSQAKKENEDVANTPV